MIKPYPPLLLSFLCLFMSGCEMIDYHPYDVRINGETDVNAHNIAEIEQKCKDKTTIKFVTMGDSQRWYDETLDFRNTNSLFRCNLIQRHRRTDRSLNSADFDTETA